MNKAAVLAQKAHREGINLAAGCNRVERGYGREVCLLG